MLGNDPFKRPDLATVGDNEEGPIYDAMGRALVAWEHAERGFAHIFGKLVAPAGSGYSAQRAYGSVIAALVRRNMIEEAAEVFFRRFIDPHAERSLKEIMSLYSAGGGRRNDIAHGIVAGDTIGGSFEYFLVPNPWGSKSRDVESRPAYRYSSAQIRELERKFNTLGGEAFKVFDQIDAAYWSSPDDARERY